MRENKVIILILNRYLYLNSDDLQFLIEKIDIYANKLPRTSPQSSGGGRLTLVTLRALVIRPKSQIAIFEKHLT